MKFLMSGNFRRRWHLKKYKTKYKNNTFINFIFNETRQEKLTKNEKQTKNTIIVISNNLLLYLKLYLIYISLLHKLEVYRDEKFEKNFFLGRYYF